MTNPHAEWLSKLADGIRDVLSPSEYQRLKFCAEMLEALDGRPSEPLLAAANAVLAHFMPSFGSSREVDDCLVQLAVAVAGRVAHQKAGGGYACINCAGAGCSDCTPSVKSNPPLQKMEHGPYDEVYFEGLKWLDENG